MFFVCFCFSFLVLFSVLPLGWEWYDFPPLLLKLNNWRENSPSNCNIQWEVARHILPKMSFLKDFKRKDEGQMSFLRFTSNRPRLLLLNLMRSTNFSTRDLILYSSLLIKQICTWGRSCNHALTECHWMHFKAKRAGSKLEIYLKEYYLNKKQ